MQAEDTIAAIATAMSPSGIGVIRVSGGKAIEVVDSVFEGSTKGRGLKEAPGYTAHYGYIAEGPEKLDEVVVLIMRAPHSYTGEDVAEIDCHGGVLVMKRVLETVIRHGARLAEPGEFTKRAFLNGRIDLSQAEAVMDVISAQNDLAVKSSLSQLGGSLSGKIKKLREDILYQTAFIEAALDDPEHYSLDGFPERLGTALVPMMEELSGLIDSADEGRILSEGIKTVILGKPNAGKSTLLNALLGEERALVTEIAGTTRDTLEEPVRLRGVNLNIIDTAGIRKTQDTVEKLGVERALGMADDADLLIYVADCTTPLDENDEKIIDMLAGKKAIVLLNKTDLAPLTTQAQLEEKTGLPVICISAKEERGIEELEEAIAQMFYSGEISFNDQVIITNVRHLAALENARKSLELVQESIAQALPEDFFTIDLLDAYEQLGTILGEAVEDDLVNEIFSRFCMGK